MMSQRSKRELAETIQGRYLKASKKDKTKILDEFVSATGYHRKYAIHLLKHGLRRRHRKKVGRKKKYTGEVVKVLERIWEICGRICSRRLHPFLPEIVEVLERHRELKLSQETKALLLSMSRSTIDRCLQKARYGKKKGLSTTKPGTLLKNSIPVRTWHDWDDAQPGFMEMDLVVHRGNTVEGQYLFTLTSVDIATGWTECFVLPTKHKLRSLKLLERCGSDCPFPCWELIQIMAQS